MCHDLLHPHGPLLVPGAGQAERFVPCGQLHSAGAGSFGQSHGQHFNENTVYVIFGLLFGQPQRVHLHTITKTAELRIFYTVALAANFVPKIDKGAHLAHLGHETDARVYKE